MGFADYPQWQQHEVMEGICQRCLQPFPCEGLMAFKPSFGIQTSMTFPGILPHATICTKETL